MSRASGPQTLRARLARTALRALGWRSIGEVPRERKYVVVCAPHTSNFDFPGLLLHAEGLGVRLQWLGKHTLFTPPFGPLMRWLGGVPVRRDTPAKRVEALAAEFARTDDLVLAIPPEGTRKRTPHWKSGFYHIAMQAQVPIALAFLDYERKLGGFGPMLWPSGDLERDFEPIRAFYTGIQGRFPDRFGPIKPGQVQIPAGTEQSPSGLSRRETR